MQTSEEMRAYFLDVTPAIPELFNIAYAICGNYDLAEYALEYALVEGWFAESHEGMGFREALRNSVRKVAFEEAIEAHEETPEFTWEGFAEAKDDPIIMLLSKESTQTQRLAALKYGCGLPAARIGRLTGMTAKQVNQTIDQFERSAARHFPSSKKRKFDVRLVRSIRKSFSRPNEDMPSVGAIYRSFQAEAAENHRPKHVASKVLRRVLICLLAILCAVVFWLAAVLIQPPVLETASLPIADFIRI